SQKCKRCEHLEVEFNKERNQWLQLIEEKEHKICTLETKAQNLEKKTNDHDTNVMKTSPVGMSDEESQTFGRINKPVHNKLSMNKDRKKVRYEESKKISPDGRLLEGRNIEINKYDGKGKMGNFKIKQECLDSSERSQLCLNNRGIVSVPDSCEPDTCTGWTQEMKYLPRKLDIQDTQDVRGIRKPSARILVTDTCYQDTMSMSPVIAGNLELSKGRRVKLRRDRFDDLRDGLQLAAVPETLDVNIDSPEPLSLLICSPTSTSTPAVERCRVSMEHDKTSLLKRVVEKLSRSDNRKSSDLEHLNMLTPIQLNESQNIAARLPSSMFTAEKLQNPECEIVQRLQFDEVPGNNDYTVVTQRDSRLSFLGNDESHPSPLLLKPLVPRHHNNGKFNLSSDVSEHSSPTKKSQSPPGKENSPIPKEKFSQEKWVQNPKKRQLQWEHDAIDTDETCVTEPAQKYSKGSEDQDCFCDDETERMTRNKIKRKNGLCDTKKKRTSRKKTAKLVQSTLTQTFGGDINKMNNDVAMDMHFEDKTFKDKFTASNIEFKKPVSPRIVNKKTDTKAVCGTNMEMNSDENFTMPCVMNGSLDPALQLSELEEDSDLLLQGCKSPTFDKSNCKGRIFLGDIESESLLCSKLANCSESLKFGAVDNNHLRGCDAEDTDMTYITQKTGVHDGLAHSKKNKKEKTNLSKESTADDSCADMFGSSHDNNGEKNDVTDVYNNDDSHHNYDNQSLETSFDRVPKSNTSLNYKHVEVVRKKDARKKLKGFNCKQCEEYFGGLDLNDEEKLERMKFCSRHRGKHTPPSTPEHYWELDMPSTQTCVERGYMKTANEKEPGRKRRRQPYQQKF
ncbi:uncharacterized protein LOC100375656, partial [Saccoglossus kowalevskii]|uniref:Uncharacterized protein LOC100375656 n=1 Tax=Saccoglossus kowalevskii TaxID=10224 RepID=A0ABM0GJK3_SACKO